MKKKVFVSIFNHLGNQLYMYAFGMSLVKNYDFDVIYEISFFKKHKGELDLNKIFEIDDFENYYLINFNLQKLLRFFPIKFQRILIKILTLGKSNNIVFEKNIDLERYGFKHDRSYSNRYYKNITNLSIFFGYWESKFYFSSIEKDLKKKLVFKKNLVDQLSTKYKPKINNNSVVLHIRKIDKGEILKNSTNINYYIKSIKYFKEKIKFPIFYIFSNDIKYSEQIIIKCLQKVIFKYDYISQYQLNMHEEFYFMTLFQNYIIPKSTFSWWACYLSKYENKNITLPKFWFDDEKIDDGRVFKNAYLI